MPAGGHREPVRSGAPVEHPIAFVLGGGGLLGAAEVGMLAALAGAGIEPDLVLGTSIGGINGAFVAAHPGSGVTQLGQLWQQDSTGTLLGDGLVSQLRTRSVTLPVATSNAANMVVPWRT